MTPPYESRVAQTIKTPHCGRLWVEPTPYRGTSLIRNIGTQYLGDAEVAELDHVPFSEKHVV